MIQTKSLLAAMLCLATIGGVGPALGQDARPAADSSQQPFGPPLPANAPLPGHLGHAPCVTPALVQDWDWIPVFGRRADRA